MIHKDTHFYCTSSAINKIQKLTKKSFSVKLRIYITGGGCSGLQYGFKLDNIINKDDLIIIRSGIKIIVDPISLQYIIGGTLDFIENINGSKFIINNPNAKKTCGCGSSFNFG